MDHVEKYLIQAFDFMGDVAAGLDSTGWAILAGCMQSLVMPCSAGLASEAHSDCLK